MPHDTLRKLALLAAVTATSGCSGADGPARAVTPRAPIDVASPRSYNRRDWHHWIDADHDCQDTRQEVLIAESEVPVEFADQRHCNVKRGRWTCPYTGRVVTNPAELDIDHLVPLQNANASGGWRWPSAKKQAFANDLEHPEALVAVAASANRQKGAKAPDQWLPPNQRLRCSYVGGWRRVKRRWGLAVTTEEVAAIDRVERSCSNRLRLDGP